MRLLVTDSGYQVANIGTSRDHFLRIVLKTVVKPTPPSYHERGASNGGAPKRKEPHVKRLMLIGVTLAMLAGLVGAAGPTIAGSASAAPAHRTATLPRHIHAASPGTVVTAGSTWTFGDAESGIHQFCIAIVFGASKIFSDDQGGAGTWKGTATSTKLTWTLGGLSGVSVKLSWVNGEPYWVGNYTLNGLTFGPTILVQGFDPLGWGGC